MQLEDIKKLQDEKVEQLSELFGCNFDEALILCHHFKWNKDALENCEWYDNQDKVRLIAGLPLITQIRNETLKTSIVYCPKCLYEVDSKDCDWLSCNHVLCKQCWSDYIIDKVLLMNFQVMTLFII